MDWIRGLAVATVLSLGVAPAFAIEGDADDDSIPDVDELGDTDDDGIPDAEDPDDDGDGEDTLIERESAPPEPDVNHNGIFDYLDADAFGSEAGVGETTCSAALL